MVAFANLFYLFVKFLVVVSVFHLFFFIDFIEGRHTYIDVTCVYKVAHIFEKESKQYATNVHSVLIGIGQNNYLFVSRFLHVERTVEARADCRYKRLNLFVLQRLQRRLFLHVQRLAPER